MTISDEAVEAAARAMAPAVWGPSVWTFVAHGENPADARDRVQKQALQDARATLEAAAPFMLARVWDEGHEEGWLNATDGITEPTGRKRNPYRKADAHGDD